MHTLTEPLTGPLTGPLSEPLTGLSGSLSAAYVAAIRAAGATVSETQEEALEAFMRSPGWSSVRMFHLPIWGVAAANAVDLVSRSAGTFAGTVTHAAGYINGDGSTGYFDTGKTPAGLGVSLASSGMGWIELTVGAPAATRIPFGCNDASNGFRGSWFSQTLAFRSMGNASSVVGSAALTAAEQQGIWSFQKVGSACAIYRRKTAGRTAVATNTAAGTGTPPAVNFFALGRNNNGAFDGANASSNQFGAFWVTSGLSDAADSALTAAIKTLWETCTGSTIP